MPAVHTTCQAYLINPDALRTLLAHGMSPNQMNWQHQTLLHHASTGDTPECAAILVDAGATMTVRDDDYRSTPLAWAARANKPQMVEFLLSRGAPVNLPDDELWATPLAWAEAPAGCLDSSGSWSDKVMECYSQSANNFQASDLNRTGMRVAVQRTEIRLALVAKRRGCLRRPTKPSPT